MDCRAPLYLQIKPPAAERRIARRCVTAAGLDESYPPERYHITLAPLGEDADWPAMRLTSLRDALAMFRAEPFAVEFDRLDGKLLRGAKRLRQPGAFQRALTAHIRRRGFKLPDYAFWLHLSLAYKGTAERRAIIAPIGWQVEEFQLVRSVHGVGHELLGRWPLVKHQLDLFG